MQNDALHFLRHRFPKQSGDGRKEERREVTRDDLHTSLSSLTVLNPYLCFNPCQILRLFLIYLSICPLPTLLELPKSVMTVLTIFII